MRQPLLSLKKKSKKQKVFCLFLVCIFSYIHVQWNPQDLCFFWYFNVFGIFGILRYFSFLSIEDKKELNKSLSQAKRKAAQMEQQLQKSKVSTRSCFCYFHSTEKRMIVTASLQKLYMIVCCKPRTSVQSYDRYWITVIDFFLPGGDSKCQAWGRVWSVYMWT